MDRLPRIRRLFSLPLTEKRVEADVADEVSFHLQSRIDELVASGVSDDAARTQAEREFGDVQDARTELARMDRVRLQRHRRFDMLDTTRQELRFALRSLIREPLFSLSIILTLGLGVGVNASMFGITDRLLFRAPPGVRNADKVKRIFFTTTTPYAGEVHSRVSSQPDFMALRASLQGVDGVGAYMNTDASMGRGAQAQKLRWVIASASLFPTLQAKTVVGRFYTDAEDEPGKGAAVVVLGNAFWKKHFGGDVNVLGREVLIGKKNYTVIGVVEPGFNGIDYEPVDMFVPLATAGPEMLGEDWNTRDVAWLRLVIRVKPGSNLPVIDQQATSLLLQDNPRLSSDKTARVTAEPAILARAPREGGNNSRMYETAHIALWLSALSLLVLIIACANVINLLLERVNRRQREVGIRMALGVGRARLISVFTLESTMLAVIGGLFGLTLARWGSGIIRHLLLPDVDWSNGSIDARVVAYTGLLVGLCTLLSAAAPALQSLRTDLTTALRSGSRAGSQRSFVRSALVGLQATISVVLLVIAGLFVRSQLNLRNMDKGFDADHVIALNLDTDLIDLAGPEADALYRQVADRVRHVPGVDDAAVGMTAPFWSSLWGQMTADGVDSIPHTKDGGPFYNGVTPEFFATVGTKIVAGRGFTAADGKGAPKVAVLSQTMARLLWPGQNPIGKCIHVRPDKACVEVVGVAHDALRDAIEGDVMMFYLPLDQQRPSGFRTVFVHASDAKRAMPAIRAAMLGIRSDMPFADMRLLSDLMSPQMRQWRLGAVLFSAFGMLALMLAALGLYSVIMYNVSQRTRELSVRVALGAGARHVIRLVVGDAARVVAAGLAVGVLISLYASKRAESLLFHVAPWDRSVFAGVLLVLIAAALIASLLPALRAMRIAPVEALKDE